MGISTDIALIDDSQDHTEAASQLLNYYGYSTAVISNPEGAIEKLESMNPRLIILDIMMPEMDGFTLLKKIKEHHYLGKIPTIILTGKAFPPEEKRAIMMGADKFLTKPIAVKDLLAYIDTYIRKSA
ncbi:MAG: response regulator [Calditrichaceae bacterium]|nr:response regulator [Calditrichaceae bacterium]MBN2707567.1 response regulator [Calditrichaceae bacterium]RQV95652.1 MAG: response regulator [Calditrichota bacterium]